MSEVDLTKYNTAARICGHVYNLLKKKIVDGCYDVNELYTFGINEIVHQCNLVYKKIERKGVAFPISINLNNSIDHSIESGTIHLNDVVKIKLGVDIDGCIAMLCETFICNEEMEYSDKYIEFLKHLRKDIIKEFRAGNTNDEIKILIESKCTENECFPIVNCKSFQHYDNQIYNENHEAKYMILNYHRLYDKNEYLMQENTCFELLQDEVYTININIVPVNDDNDDIDMDYTGNTDRIDEKMYLTDLDVSYLYRLTDNYYDFKLQSSKQFYSKVFSKHHYNVFDIREYTSNVKNKLGIREAKNIGVLDVLPVRYAKNKKSVYSCSFTVVIKRNTGLQLKYY